MLRTMWYNLLMKIAKKSIIAQHEKIERTALQPSISINKGDDKIFYKMRVPPYFFCDTYYNVV